MVTLMLMSYGITVRKKSETLIVQQKYSDKGEYEKKETQIPVKRLTGIVTSLSTHFTNQALALLLSYGIPVILFDRIKIAGVIHPFYSHGTVVTRREQFQAFYDHRGVELMKAFVAGPLATKANILLSYAKNRKETYPEKYELLRKKAYTIREQIEGIDELMGDIEEIRNILMGIEGNGTRLYYEGIAAIIPEEYGFEKRVKRPPTDVINAALSYGYVILDSRCLIQVVAAGLDPYAGYLHADRSGRPSLALDISEEFRQPIIDRIVFEMAIKREWDKKKDFEEDGGRVLLTKEGKKKFFSKLEERYETTIQYDGKSYKFEHILLLQARKIIHYLIGKKREYEIFKYR